MRPGEIDQIGTGQQRTGAEHHHLLAGAQHRPADLIEDISRCTFDNEVGVPGQLIERDQRTGDTFSIEPCLRFRPIPCRDRRESKSRQPLRQLARHGFADLPEPGNGDIF